MRNYIKMAVHASTNESMNKHIGHCKFFIYNLIVILQRKMGKIRIKFHADNPLVLRKIHHPQD